MPIVAFAQVIQVTGMVFTTELKYISADDNYRIDLNPYMLSGGSVLHTTYSDSQFTNQVFQGQAYFDYNLTYAYALYNCKLYNWDRFYNASGDLIGDIKFYPDQLINDRCTSSYSPATSTTPFSPPSGFSDTNIVNSVNEGDTNIINNINNMNDNLGLLLGTNNDLLTQILGTDQSILSGVNGILAQLQTSKSLDTGSVPNSPTIDTGNLDSEKPSESAVYHDNDVKFSDSGDSSDGSPDIPAIPSVALCWSDICRQPDGKADTPLNPDSELSADFPFSSDLPLTVDKFNSDSVLNKDSELQTDQFSSDSQMTQDTEQTKDSFSKESEMTQDSFSKDSEMNKDSISQDAVPSKTNSFDQNNFYSQDTELSVSN